MVSPLIRQTPGPAGRSAWLTALLTVPAAALLGRLTGWLLARRRPGEGLGDLLVRSVGPAPGRMLAALFGLWFLCYGGFVLRAGADRFVSAVYPASPVWLFLVVTALLGLPAGLGRLRTLGRFAEVAAPALTAVFALVFLFSAELLDPGELWPLSREDVLRALAAAPGLLNALSVGIYYAFLAGEVDPGGLCRSFSRPLAALCALEALLSAVTVGSFGEGLSGRMNYPFFVLLRNLRVFHLLDRAEALVAAQWVVTDFLLLSSLLHLASGTLRLALRGSEGEGGPVLTLLCAAGMLLAGFFCAPTSFALRALGERTIPLVHAVLVFGALPLALGLGILRKKI